MNWTKEQQDLINEFATGNGHFVTEAKAGSGKSTTINEGLNHAPEKSILYAVFNKKLQVEFSGKVKNPNVSVKTLHSHGFSFILKNWRGVRASGYVENNRIKQIFPDAPAQFIFQTAALVKYLKNTCVDITKDDCLKAISARDFTCIDKHKLAGWDDNKMTEAALKSLELSCEYPKDKQVSFEDMIFLPLKMGWVKPSFDLIALDETQDLSMPQVEIVLKSILPNGRIGLVGDSLQKIYGFRGSLHNCMDIFAEKLSAKRFSLSISFRCPKKIVELAQTVVPDIKHAPNAIDGEIKAISGDLMIATVKPYDAILSRTNAPLAKNCLALIRKGIPAYIEGKDFARTLTTIVENLQANTVGAFLDNLQAWQTIQVSKATGYNAASKIELVNDQVETIRVICESVLDFNQIIPKIESLFKDSNGEKLPSVVLSSVHRAKGLEWTNVFMLAETFNKSRANSTPEERQEEINIYYVAVTRSKHRLYMVN